MIDDKMAKMAVNTLKKYCNTNFKTCNKCAVKDACCMPCRVFGNMNEINDVGTFESWRKPSERPPKFDIRQKDSAYFREYINKIVVEEVKKYELPIRWGISIKWSADGRIKISFFDDDGYLQCVGVAKCHPDDAFNPEIGIKLAIERAAQVMHAMNDMNKYERTIPKAGEKWMHFKGHVYEIIGFGNHTERMELVVIYHEAGDCTYWVRPLEKFMSKVDHNKYPDVPYKWRFWKVSDAEQ